MVFAKDVKSYDSSKVDFGSHDEFSVSVKGHLYRTFYRELYRALYYIPQHYGGYGGGYGGYGGGYGG